jgi:hypothetical protein
MFGREAAISLKREVARESHVDIAVLQASLMRAFGTHIRTPYNAHNARFSGITVLPPEYFDHTRNLANSSVLHKRKHLEAIIKDTAEPTTDKPLVAHPKRLIVDKSYGVPKLGMEFWNEQLYREQKDCAEAAEEYFGTQIPLEQNEPLLYLGRLANGAGEDNLAEFELPFRLIVQPLHIKFDPHA